MSRLWPLLVGVIFLVSGQPALACSCAQSTKAQHAERAVAVFAGTVTAVASPLFGMQCSRTDSDVGVTFAVDTVYKGDVPRDFSLKTGMNGAGCGYSFAEGKRYTVFVLRLEGEYQTNSCVGNVEGAITPTEYGLAVGSPPRP